MTLRHKQTGEVKQLKGAGWRVSMGWWTSDNPLSMSYPVSEWEEVVSEDSPQS